MVYSLPALQSWDYTRFSKTKQQKKVPILHQDLFKYDYRLSENFYFTASITALKASG
jgi:hypothetical protein